MSWPKFWFGRWNHLSGGTYRDLVKRMWEDFRCKHDDDYSYHGYGQHVYTCKKCKRVLYDIDHFGKRTFYWSKEDGNEDRRT